METHVCSGVILNEKFILTTGKNNLQNLFSSNASLFLASCLNTFKNENRKIKLGVGLNNKENDLIEIYDEGRMAIKRTIIHEEFNSTTLFDNDIALVELTEKIQFKDSRFRPICLLKKGKLLEKRIFFKLNLI